MHFYDNGSNVRMIGWQWRSSRREAEPTQELCRWPKKYDTKTKKNDTKKTKTDGDTNTKSLATSLVCCTTCRLFRSQSQMTTDGQNRFGHCEAVGPLGEDPWRGQSKKLAGTLPKFWPFARGPNSRRTAGIFVIIIIMNLVKGRE